MSSDRWRVSGQVDQGSGANGANDDKGNKGHESNKVCLDQATAAV